MAICAGKKAGISLECRRARATQRLAAHGRRSATMPGRCDPPTADHAPGGHAHDRPRAARNADYRWQCSRCVRHTRIRRSVSVCSRERRAIRGAKPRADAACGGGRAPDLQRAAQVSTLYCPLKERRDELRPLTSLASPRLVAARRHTDTGTPRWLKVSTSAPFMPDACGRCLRRVPDSRHACPCMSHASTVCV